MNRFLVFLMVATTIVACNQNAGENQDKSGAGFVINAEISGIDTAKVNLMKVVDGSWAVVDSTKCKGGKFTLKGHVDFPEMYVVAVGDNRHAARIFLDNSQIELVGQYDSLRNANITGSKSQYEMKLFENETAHFEDKMQDLGKQYKEARAAGDKQTMEQIANEYQELMKDYDKFTENYVITNNTSVASPYILSQIAYSLEVDKLDSILNLFDKSLDSSAYTKRMKEKVAILKKVAIGKKAPDFTLNDTTGNPISMSSFKGKYLLIDFWASWCGPCRAENPHNVALYKEFKGKDFEILGVSLDDKRENWVAAIKSDNLTWPQVSDLKGWKSSVGKLYGVSGIPHTVLLDKEGVIIAKDLRGEKLREKVAEVLKK